ncbi:hypothetical protein TYRP_023291 [Tyrophagus putrescentiae]|nr:hypothetical protein TYRP_023291 [Tyrophagus putrescentiae]
MAASVNGFSNTALSTSSSSSAATATAAAATSSSSALSSAKTDPVKKLPSTKTASKDVAAAARQKQKATEKRLGSDKFSKEQVSELFAVLEEVRNTGNLGEEDEDENLKKILIPKNWMQMTTRRTRRKKIRRRRIWGGGGEEKEEEEEENERKRMRGGKRRRKRGEKVQRPPVLTLLRIDIWQKWPPSTTRLLLLSLNADPNQAEAEGQLNLWSAVFKVLKFADVTFSRVTAYMLKLIIWELCEGPQHSTGGEGGAGQGGRAHREMLHTEEEEALLYELLAEIPQTQMELQTTKTRRQRKTKKRSGSWAL